MTQDILLQMQELVEQLNHASEQYYAGRDEAMTDFEWDAKFDELKQLEQESGTVLPNSPTMNVSSSQENGMKESHEYPALSLAKTKNPEELVKWAEQRPIWLSWKLDGLTLVVTYDLGHLTKIVTRGNGHVGTNITHLAAAIQGIPATIPDLGHTVIRGEAVISYADFEQFNLEAEEAFANPRNLASGSLTLKDVEEVKRRRIQWIPFSLVYTENDINSWGERMDWMKQQGLKVVDHEFVSDPSFDKVTEVIDRWTEKVVSKSNAFPVDGLVIAYDDTSFAATGSVTGHHATRSGLAFKWQDEEATTELEYIEWSCATSTISPVAVFKAVELEGTTVRRASLCNISECERLGIGGPGTMISVIKANKIIPKVVQVIRTEGPFEIPTHCPVCHHDTIVETSEGSGTKTLHCTNEACPAKQLKKFERFVSKGGINIDGISEQTIAKFINLGWIKTYADIYHLAEYANKMATLEGFGEKSVSNILRSIEKSREVEARHFLFALSIPLCGIDVCTRLLGAYALEDLIRIASETQQPDVFADIPNLGPEKSASFVRWFQITENRTTVADLMAELTIHQDAIQPTGSLCKDLTFVITGDMLHFKNRAELKTYIESQGGKVTGSVSKSTDFLINNDTTSTSGKNKKAKELGIKTISEDQFIDQFTIPNESFTI